MSKTVEPEYRKQLPEIEDVTQMHIINATRRFKFENQTHIFFTGPECGELRGHNIDRLIFDEFDDLKELDADNWLNMWFPMMLVDKRIVALSTPRGMKQMYRLWSRDDESWIKIRSSWRETGLFSYRDVLNMQTYRSPVEIDNGYNCEFADMRNREYRKELMRR